MWQNLRGPTYNLMPLVAGTRLGPYEIQSAIGAGGMGEVYRARDTKLDRDVAIKILPEGFAIDPERIARFQREAKTLASLNHPNIGGIYGLEEAAVAVRGSATRFEPDVAKPLFPIPGNEVRRSYAPSADGRRFLITRPLETTTEPITVVLNWQAELQK